MDLKLALKITRQIIERTTSAEIKIEADSSTNVYKLVIPLNYAGIDYLETVMQVLKTKDVKAWFEDDCIMVMDVEAQNK